MKKLFTLFVAVMASIGSMIVTASPILHNGIYYNLNSSNQTATVAQGDYSGPIDIPSEFEYEEVPYTVTQIGSSAFENCTGLTSVIIPESVTNIGKYAFGGCSSLDTITINSNTIVKNGGIGNIFGYQIKKVYLGENITAIGNNTFKDCKNITSFSIPSTVTSIGGYAFYGCSGLTSIIIPDGVTSIGQETFEGCTSLASVTIGNSVKEIGNEAFFGCTSLTSLDIPNSVTTIAQQAFLNCKSLRSIRIGKGVTSFGQQVFEFTDSLKAIYVDAENPNYCDIDSVLFTKDQTTLLQYPVGRLSTSYEIPGSVTSIGDYAFWYGVNLKSVIIPNSVNSIGYEAFHECTHLSSIIIPDNVSSIGEYAFWNCFSLTSVTVPSSVTSVGGSSFLSVPNVVYSGTLTNAPWGARSLNGYVEDWLVYDSSKKTNLLACSAAATGEIAIPEGVTKIENDAFARCQEVTAVSLPNSLNTIGEYAFNNCSNMISIDLGNGVSTIGTFAFIYCSNLKSIRIPASVTSIEDFTAFRDCIGLTEINVDASNKKYSDKDGVLFNKAKDILIQYPVGNPRESYSIPEGVTNINYYAFDKAGYLTSVTIPNSVTTIGASAFFKCENLTSVTIPNSVTSMGYSAFACIPKLKSVHISNKIEVIPERAFQSCPNLESVTIPASVTSIEGRAFMDCTGLKSITCEALEPPTVDNDNVFTNVDKTIPLYVPFGSMAEYKKKSGWRSFNIQPILADVVEEAITQAEPTDNSVVIEWPKNDEAAIYTVIIKKGNDTICTLEFDEQGQMLSIAYAAPSRDGRSQQPRMATQTTTGWQYTINGLEANTEYEYIVIAKRSDSTEAYKETIPFTTAQTPTALDQTSQEPRANSQKLIRDGQILILRGDKTFTLQGQEVK